MPAEIRATFAQLGDGILTLWAICARTGVDPANPNREFVVNVVRASRDVIESQNSRGLFEGPLWRELHRSAGDAVFIVEDPHNHPNDPNTPKRKAQAGVGDRYRPATNIFTDRQAPTLTDEQRAALRLERRLARAETLLEQETGAPLPPIEEP